MKHERGSMLLESMISATTVLLLLAALMPFLLATRQLVSRLAAQAAKIDAVRLAAFVFRDESRRAGFGLSGHGATIADDGASVTLAYLDGGFDGGHAVASPATAGESSLELRTLGDLSAGQDVVIVDVWGRTIDARLRAVDRPARRVELTAPLPRDVLPEEGARLHVRIAHTWSAGTGGVRRDGRLVSAELDLLAWVPGVGDGPADWLAALAGGGGRRNGEVDGLLLGAVRGVAVAGTARRLTARVATRSRQSPSGSPRP